MTTKARAKPTKTGAPGSRAKGWPQTLLFLALCLALLVATLWATLALFIDVRVSWLRPPLAVLYVVAILAVWIFIKGRWRKLGISAGAFVLILGWWLTLKPSNDRDWQPDLAVLPYAEINGNRVTVRNIRNCDYRTETDFDVRHYDRTFDLEKLQSADLYMVYWGSPLMAHTMITFNFEGGDNVCFSIETRKKRGDNYSAVKGLFRQFELAYVIADERDLVRLRTNYRQGEEVYLYRLKSTPEQAQRLFLDYLNRANQLRDRPEWYNAVSDNCTTAIRTQRAASDRAPWDWRILVNGLGNELLYERGRVATNVPLAELKERGHVNARAKAADKAENFSQLIRVGVPGINEPQVTPTNTVVAPNQPPAQFQKLVGKWLRPDGGYVIEIKSVDGAGKLDAGYFNPRPIHVAKAEAKQAGNAMKVFIELQDVNYPGSTYTLTYLPERDLLAGVYFQAVQRQEFEVYFERLK